MWFSEKKLQVSVSDKKLQVQFQIRNCNFQRQSIYINTAFSNRVNIMLEVLFMVENGTTSQLTSCWSTFMHSTSSYDAQSKCPHNVECAKHRENEGRSFGKCWTWFWAAPSRLSFLTCAAHDLGWEVHRPVCIFLGPSCIDRPMDLPSEVLFLAAQFMYFFSKKTHRSVLFFYIRIGMLGTTYVSLLTILCHHIFNRYLHM